MRGATCQPLPKTGGAGWHLVAKYDDGGEPGQGRIR